MSRRRFFLVALSPHVVWLINNEFSSLRWAGGFVGEVSHRAYVAIYLGHHFALLAFVRSRPRSLCGLGGGGSVTAMRRLPTSGRSFW
jgi:hypothetical protein